MGADISGLRNLRPSEPLDLNDGIYKDAGEGRPFPRKGRYTLRAPEAFEFGETDAGNLRATIDPIIVDGPSEGFKVRFVRVSNKTFKRGAGLVSWMGDYLRACGIKGNLPSDPQEQADLIEGTANTVYTADLDWKLYDSARGIDLKGQDKFPKDDNGEPIPFIEVDGVDDTGNPIKQRLWANLQVTRFVSA